MDDFGNPIQLLDPVSQDTILFEVAYTTIEFAFGKAESIREVEERFTFYMATIQNKLGELIMLLLAAAFIPTGIKMRIVQWLIPLSDVDGLSEFGRNVTKSDLHHFLSMEPLYVGVRFN